MDVRQPYHKVKQKRPKAKPTLTHYFNPNLNPNYPLQLQNPIPFADPQNPNPRSLERCQASKTAFRSRCARPGGTLHVWARRSVRISSRARTRVLLVWQSGAKNLNNGWSRDQFSISLTTLQGCLGTPGFVVNGGKRRSGPEGNVDRGRAARQLQGSVFTLRHVAVGWFGIIISMKNTSIHTFLFWSGLNLKIL